MSGFTLFQELQVSGREACPENTVIGGFGDPDRAEQVLSALVEDFGRLNVTVLFGPEGLRMLDADGQHDSFLDGASHAVEQAVTESRGLPEQVATLRRGGYLVYVDVADEKQKKRAVETLKAHEADHVVHRGRVAIEHL